MNSAQLDLWEAELSALPWRGVRPRVLTRGSKVSIFKAQAVERTTDFVDADQLPLFPELVKKAPREYRGAPLLKEV